MLADAALPTSGAPGTTLYAVKVMTIATRAADDTRSLQVKPIAATPVRLMWKAPQFQSALSENAAGSPGGVTVSFVSSGSTACLNTLNSAGRSTTDAVYRILR